MTPISYNISEITTILSNRLKEHKLVFTQAYEKYSLELQYSRIEQGLYYINLKVNSIEDIEFVQIAERSNDWAMIYYAEKSMIISQKKYESGVYTGFSDREISFCCESGTEICLNILLLHKDFMTIYNYNAIFEGIRQKEHEFYCQPFSQQITYLLEGIYTRKSLIKTKQSIMGLLNIFYFEAADIKNNLSKNIDSFCAICLQNKIKINISSFLSERFRCDNQIFEKLFFEKFGTNIQNYFENYKINKAKKFLRLEKDAVDNILTESINQHLPNFKQLEVQLGLSTKVFKSLFFEEFGVTIYDYYISLRLKFTKEILFNESKKIYQVSQHLGYSHPTDLIQFFYRHEGITPKQMVIRQKRASNYDNVSLSNDQ